MEEYPSITRVLPRGLSIYAFDKLDGSNIRAEWSKRRGFYKFGSRTRLLGTDQNIAEAQEVIENKYGHTLGRAFSESGWERAMAFFEFFGPSSFAGAHESGEPKDVLLFDISLPKTGLLNPSEYLALTEGLPIASLLYHGPCDAEFIESVRSGQLSGMTAEGVVCKAKNPKRHEPPVLFKIKTTAWIEKLRGFCGEDKYKFEALL